MIEKIDGILGRSYTIAVDSSGNIIGGIAGVDFSYIIGSLFLLVATVFFIKCLFKFLESIFMLRR